MPLCQGFFFVFFFYQDHFSLHIFANKQRGFFRFFKISLFLLQYLLYFVCARPALFKNPFRQRDCWTSLHSPSVVLLNSTSPAAPATVPPVFLCWYYTAPPWPVSSFSAIFPLAAFIGQFLSFSFCFFFFFPVVFCFLIYAALLQSLLTRTIQLLSWWRILSFFAIGGVNLWWESKMVTTMLFLFCSQMFCDKGCCEVILSVDTFMLFMNKYFLLNFDNYNLVCKFSIISALYTLYFS